MYRLLVKEFIGFHLLIVLWTQPLPATSQAKYQLYIEGLEARFYPPKKMLDSVNALYQAGKIVQKLQRSGYWMASLDQCQFGKDSISLKFYQGRKFDQFDVSVTEVSGLETVYRQRFIKKQRKIQHTEDLNDFIESTLELYENNGYPFVQLKFDSASTRNHSIVLKIKIEKGPLIKYDSLSVDPLDVIKSKFLSNYLRMKPGDYYSASDVALIADRMEQLPFLTLTSLRTSYQLKQAKIQLEVAPRKVNYFDGILGFVPNRDQQGVELTGELNLSLKNLFQSAKSLEFHWTKLSPGSQQLDVGYVHPALFGSRIGVEATYNQLKQDTLFSNRRMRLQFNYHPKPRVATSFFYENREGNELDDGSRQSGDFRINFYGASLRYARLNNYFNPTDGWVLDLTGSVGDKKDFDQRSLSTQYRGKTKFEILKPIVHRSVVSLGVQGGIVLDDQFFINDLFRIGGLKTVRGFDESAIFASKYAILNSEWRYYFESSSYLLAFFDLAFTQFEVLENSEANNYQGFGAGMNLSTNNGQFIFLYAFGRSADQGFSFDSSKMHLGYVANF